MTTEIQSDARHGDLPQAEENNKDYRVGYCKPPLETRFKKGQSGNPRGRPKSFDELRALVRAVGDEPFSDTERTRIEEKIRQLFASNKPHDIETLLAYGWGKPRDETDLTVRGIVATEDYGALSAEEREKRIDELLQRRAERLAQPAQLAAGGADATDATDATDGADRAGGAGAAAGGE